MSYFKMNSGNSKESYLIFTVIKRHFSKELFNLKMSARLVLTQRAKRVIRNAKLNRSRMSPRLSQQATILVSLLHQTLSILKTIPTLASKPTITNQNLLHLVRDEMRAHQPLLQLPRETIMVISQPIRVLNQLPMVPTLRYKQISLRHQIKLLLMMPVAKMGHQLS